MFVSVAVVKAVLGGDKVSVIVVHAGVALYGVVNVVCVCRRLFPLGRCGGGGNGITVTVAVAVAVMALEMTLVKGAVARVR